VTASGKVDRRQLAARPAPALGIATRQPRTQVEARLVLLWQGLLGIDTVGIGDPHASGEAKVDTATLQKVAATTGGRYFFGQDEGQLEQIYATLDRITPANYKTLSWRPKRELFQYPLGAAVLAVLAYHLVMFVLVSLRRLTRRAGARAVTT